MKPILSDEGASLNVVEVEKKKKEKKLKGK
jgi:hypothetical protein